MTTHAKHGKNKSLALHSEQLKKMVVAPINPPAKPTPVVFGKVKRVPPRATAPNR